MDDCSREDDESSLIKLFGSNPYRDSILSILVVSRVCTSNEVSCVFFKEKWIWGKAIAKRDTISSISRYSLDEDLKELFLTGLLKKRSSTIIRVPDLPLNGAGVG